MIDKATVQYIAELARLELDESEIEASVHHLGSIIGHMDQLENVDTSGVEPTCFMIPEHFPGRDDVVLPSLLPEQALANGPKVVDGFFAVPKVIQQ